ncbi:7701_t:CDS:2, partial [Diversispora eburnea]
SENEELPTINIKEGLTSLKKWIKFMSKKQKKLDSIFSTDMSFEITEVDTLNYNFEMNENSELEDNINVKYT